MKKLSEVLTDESKWCKGSPFNDLSGNPCSISNAVKCCLLGATEIALDDTNPWFGYLLASRQLHENLRDGIVKLYPNRCEGIRDVNTNGAVIALFNDHPDTTFEDIKKLLVETNN